MELILNRINTTSDTTDGCITIDGRRVCDTAEHTPTMLKPGRYTLKRSKLYLMAGNGVYALRKPAVIVGVHRCRGLVINSRLTYHRIHERLKKAFARKEEVVLVVEP